MGMEKPPLHFSLGCEWGGEERGQWSIRYDAVSELAWNCSSPGRRITRDYPRSNGEALTGQAEQLHRHIRITRGPLHVLSCGFAGGQEGRRAT